ncbi:hypothetical protein BDV33DRAFT_171448 [Aspergillus novoparasiticus]|uniref:Uncharacterized protein n=1 Tax=Aspergillus novoparasiticus TaxID=986946 RepID=A0A5N6EVJ3_9EURO|nr:hypothetical protein BDV33DRAFT_171448 [Aspergillus novoparasiticus]
MFSCLCLFIIVFFIIIFFLWEWSALRVVLFLLLFLVLVLVLLGGYWVICMHGDGVTFCSYNWVIFAALAAASDVMGFA